MRATRHKTRLLPASDARAALRLPPIAASSRLLEATHAARTRDLRPQVSLAARLAASASAPALPMALPRVALPKRPA